MAYVDKYLDDIEYTYLCCPLVA